VILFTAYVWTVAGVILFWLGVVLSILPAGPLADRVVRRCAWLALSLTGCRPRVSGLEHLTSCGPVVLVANHASYLDSIVLLATIPVSYRFVVNHQAAAWPVIGLAIRKAGHLVVDRSLAASRHACARSMLETLRRRTSLLVFPEGTTHRDGALLPFRPGAFRIAVAAARPVVPISVRGTDRLLPRGEWRFRRTRPEVTIQPPIVPADGGRQEVLRLRDDARRALATEGVPEPLLG
jgi:fatty-acyl-CoA synthase